MSLLVCVRATGAGFAIHHDAGRHCSQGHVSNLLLDSPSLTGSTLPAAESGGRASPLFPMQVTALPTNLKSSFLGPSRHPARSSCLGEPNCLHKSLFSERRPRGHEFPRAAIAPRGREGLPWTRESVLFQPSLRSDLLQQAPGCFWWALPGSLSEDVVQVKSPGSVLQELQADMGRRQASSRFTGLELSTEPRAGGCRRGQLPQDCLGSASRGTRGLLSQACKESFLKKN